MINWLKNWKKRRKELEFQNGYEFAAGVLLKTGSRDHVIRELEDRANNPFDYRSTFDLGVLGAIKDYTALVEGETLDH